jgi:flavin reductase (DIM6/NTAB) family NADH-FMN oxidoreductase RutF
MPKRRPDAGPAFEPGSKAPTQVSAHLTGETHKLPAIAPEQFKEGMRRLAAGVTIITTAEDGTPSGLTATAVCSLSVEPPQILVCVKRTAGAHDAIARSRRFCVNVLAHGHHNLAARFAGHDGVRGEARFRAGRWVSLKTGAPSLAGALASFDCVVSEQVAATTHTIFIGQVVAMSVRQKAKPLLYASGGYASVQALARALKKRQRRVAARARPRARVG